MWLELTTLGILLWLVYKIFFDHYNYWESKGFPAIKGNFPLGSKLTLSFLSKYRGYVLEDYYNELSPNPYGGFYLYRKPILLLRDPEIIKHVMIKDFSHFRNRFESSNSKELLMGNLFSLEGDLWKSVRVKLTPTFTSGKLKMMYSIFEVCAENFQKILIKEQQEKGEIEIKDVVARFTTDIISSCAFGLEVDTINNPLSEFRKICSKLFPPYIPPIRKIREVLFFLCPSLLKILKFRAFPKHTENFLLNLVKDTISYRDINNVQRNDFLDLLLKLRKNNVNPQKQGQENDNLEMDLDMITAQCFAFLAAGFETSSSVQSYALYELACNQDVQNKLREEIDSVLAKHGGKPTYQALQEMSYMEQVINETMRKYPTLPLITRQCIKNYKTPDLGLEIEEGTLIYIPIYALHHDPKYFPNPDVFNPDRFSEDNKNSITPFTFLPFGEGPRICIGSRFGLLQTKLGLLTVLRDMKVLPSEKCVGPLKFGATTTISVVAHPICLRLEKIK